MTQGLCTVVIPAYNAEAYIQRAIESALGQSYPAVEVMVVDDGSTDGTADVIRSFGSAVTFLEQPNLGPGAARNLAIRRSSAEYVAFLDADDAWLPQRLSRLIAVLEEARATFVTSDAFIIYEDRTTDETYYRSILPKGWRFHDKDQAYWIMQYNYVLTMTVVRSELFARHGMFDESLRSCEDWDLWGRFITAGEHVGLVNEPLGFYRVRRDSLARQIESIAANTVTVLERALRRPEVQPIKGVAANLRYARGIDALLRSDFAGARRHHLAAMGASGLTPDRRLRAAVTVMTPRLSARLKRRLTPGLAGLRP